MLQHLQQISSKSSPIGCRAKATRLCNAGRSARLGRVSEFLQAPVEIADIDRPDKGVDHRRDPLCLARRHRTAGQRRGHRLHRRGDIVGLQPTWFVPWGRSRSAASRILPRARGRTAGCVRGKAALQSVAGESDLDRPAGQRVGLTHQKRRGAKRRLVAQAGLSPGGIARPPLLVRPLPCPPRAPVPPVLSGSDQALATPSITISHRLDELEGLEAYNAIVSITR